MVFNETPPESVDAPKIVASRSGTLIEGNLNLASSRLGCLMMGKLSSGLGAAFFPHCLFDLVLLAPNLFSQKIVLPDPSGQGKITSDLLSKFFVPSG